MPTIFEDLLFIRLRELNIITAYMVDALPSFLFPHAPNFAADHYYGEYVAFVLPGMKVLYNQVVNVIRHYREIVRNTLS